MLRHDGGNEQGLYSVLRMSVTTAAVLTRLKKCWSAERESQVRSPGPEPILMVLKQLREKTLPTKRSRGSESHVEMAVQSPIGGPKKNTLGGYFVLTQWH